MGFTLNARNSSSEGWGMGFLLVFFPEDERIDTNKKRANIFSSSLPSSSSSSPDFTINNTSSPLRRTTNHLLSRAQSTVSICAVLIFITLLLFTLSTFEPTTAAAAAASRYNSRRHLSSNPKSPNKPNEWSIDIFSRNSRFKPDTPAAPNLYALQGLGSLYRRGTRAMNDLIVGHVVESVTEQEVRLFLRLMHRSGLTSKADLVLIFSSVADSAAFESVIREENESFSKLIGRIRERNSTATNSGTSFESFDATQFVKSSKKATEWGEPLWGRRIRSNYSDGGETVLTRLSYGSVVSFVADELDPEKSLAGFLDHVPMRLRRWACYPMLLGRVRRNFKHIMLADVKEVLILGDPLSRVRTRSPESVRLSTEASAPAHNKHGKRNSGKTQSRNEQPVNSAMIMGGARGVRRLSIAMLTGIVRAATEKKRKSSISEYGLFNQLVGNEFILKNANVVTSTESVPDASSLTRLHSNSGSSTSLAKHAVVWRGNSNNADSASSIMKRICSLESDSSVYSDCVAISK